MGCRILVRVEPQALATYAEPLFRAKIPTVGVPPELSLGKHVNVHPHVMFVTTLAADTEPEWRRLCQFLTESDEELLAYFPKLLGPRATGLTTEQATLIQRGFSDCSEVFLTDLPQGRSGASVLLAYPTIARPVQGEGVPLVIKFDDRNDIAAEHENYESHLRPFVPYHLGPHLVVRRCCLGSQIGALVATFVEESESLLQCAISGRGAGVVSGLLDRTLAGWWRSAQRLRVPFAVEIAKQLPNEIESARADEAKRVGAKHSLGDLRAHLRSFDEEYAWCGHLHGDLHAENVRIRGGDAVLIDFGKCTSGPVLYDPAALEASLLIGDVEAERRAGHDVAVRSWERRARLLCEEIELGPATEGAPMGKRWDWLHAAVREIRLLAMSKQGAPDQYAIALGVALVRASARRVGDQRRPADSRRRAFAYVLGERLIMRART
jgi:hypothetical protein